MLWCEIGPDLPACIRLLELTNTKTAGRDFRAEMPSLGFRIREFEEAENICENVRGNHSNRATAAHPNPRKQKQPAFSVENTGWCLRRMWDLNPRGS